MIKFTKSNTSVYTNGNIAMSLYDPHVSDLKEHLEEVKIIWDSGDTQTKEMGLLNTSNEPILLKGGYNTTANGECDDLILEPGEAMIRTSIGDAYFFSYYRKMRIV